MKRVIKAFKLDTAKPKFRAGNSRSMLDLVFSLINRLILFLFDISHGNRSVSKSGEGQGRITKRRYENYSFYRSSI